MATSSNSKEATQPQFSLKHRLIGAGILISFGVLFLPWLLGSYSTEQNIIEAKAQKNVQPSSIATLATKAATKTLKGGTKELADTNDKKDVDVFISRVQPVQSDANKNNKQVKSPAKAPVDAAVDIKKESATKKSVPSKVDDKAVAKKSPKKQAEKLKNKKIETAKPESKKEVVKKSPTADSTTQSKGIKRGYIVSVGVFGDAKNVQKMVSDLKSREFNPSVREEKFNDKSVSRIYMGPFKTRAEAGKVKLRLSEKQNIPSLIKEFP